MNLAIIPNEIVQALCWTLLHSLWQGLLLAIITGIILVATKKSGAAIRYKLLTGLFFLFVVTAVITFIKTYLSITPAQTSSNTDAQFLFAPDFTLTGAKEIELSFYQKFTAYFNQHASLIITVWFVIFLARFIKLASNLLYIQRIRHYKTFAPAPIWQDNVLVLAAKMNLSRTITLLESAIVKVPAVIGMAKPVILVPVGLLTKLPVEEIEAILLHELAHIKRRDYMVNLLQSLMETIFFFNPAVFWLSSMIREERENCCDDMAIAITNNKKKFINALISFQEYNLSAPAHSMGFPGKKNHLLNRVKRIVHERNKTLNGIEKSILSFSLILLICFSFIAAKKDTTVTDKKQKSTASAGKQDTTHLIVTAVLDMARDSSQTQTVTASAVVNDNDSSRAGTKDSTYIILDNPRLNAASPQDTTKKISFQKMRTETSATDSSSSVDIMAVTTTGTTYVLKKKNGQITYFSIDDKEIDEAHLAEHLPELHALEQASNNSRTKQEHRTHMEIKTRQPETMIHGQATRDVQLRKNIEFNYVLKTDSIKVEKKDFKFVPRGHFKMQSDTLHLAPMKPLQKIKPDSKQWVMLSGDIKTAQSTLQVIQ
ncbi:MAG: M56 family metallopeptidase [Filimonas sp.]|nr:M56 family metallopeptidase [Filimonas sp.]